MSTQNNRRGLCGRGGHHFLLLLFTAIVTAAAAASAADAVDASSNVPDISGPWVMQSIPAALKDANGNPPPLTSEALAIYQHNQQHPDADPLQRCLPPGVPRAFMQKGFAFNIVQGMTMYAVMLQWNHLNRVIYMNQEHFEGIGPQYFGQSVGRWDKDTLVVKTNSYNDATYLDNSGLPHSDQLETTERLHLKAGGKVLEDDITFTDPKTFTRPWNAVLEFQKRPGAIITEDYCLGRTGQGTLRQVDSGSGKP